MTPEHIDPPSTIKEVGIHIGYMREDISELKKLIEQMPGAFATKDDLAGLTARVIILEKKSALKNTIMWVVLVASAIINVVVIYQLFTGGK